MLQKNSQIQINSDFRNERIKSTIMQQSLYTTERTLMKTTKRKSPNRKKQEEMPRAQPQISENLDCKRNASICSPETACDLLADGTYRCVCPHDRSEPTKDRTCPNRMTVNLDPSRIDLNLNNVETKKDLGDLGTINYTDVLEQVSRSSPPHRPMELTALLVGVLLFGGLIIGLLAWWGRRTNHCRYMQRKRSKQGSIRTMKKDALLPERYTPNPQYSACPTALPILNRESLVFLQEIGEGCFGKVFKGELRHDGSCDVVAVKVLKDTAGREAEEDFLREVDIMSAFRHDNILTLVGVVMRDGANSPWMVFEFMPHGDLAEVLRANASGSRQRNSSSSSDAPVLDRNSLLSIALQVALGMRYLSAQRFVHRDLACRNCLVGAGLTVKIADFGMSRDVYTCDYYKIGGNRLLPIRWMSPESVMYGRFTLESDVWSYAVLLWEVYSLGLQPYYGHSNDEVVKLILQGIMLIPPEGCPPFVCEVMRSCWKTEPRDRIGFPEICEKLSKAAEEAVISAETAVELPRPPVRLPPMDIIQQTEDADGYLRPQRSAPPEYMEAIP